MIYTAIQELTIKDIFRTAGLKESQIVDIFGLLGAKTEAVQLVFYYRACGATYKEAGKMVGVSKRVAHYKIINQCEDIKKYLKSVTNG